MDRLSVREIRVLALLKERDSMGLTDISYTLNIPPSTVHGMLLRLQALGLIERNDAKQFQITEKGLQALAKIQAILSVEAR